MKTKFTQLFFALSIVLISSILLISEPLGAPAGYTGSPGDANNCGTACHGVTPTRVTNVLNANIPSSGYTPNATYNITVSISGSPTSKKGFQVSTQDNSGNLKGVLVAGAGSKTVGMSKYVTHNMYKTDATSIWIFNWTAPVSGSGSVGIYGAFVNNKPNVSLQSLMVNESTSTAVNELNLFNGVEIYPNPASDFINIKLNNKLVGIFTLQLFDMTGKEKMNVNLNASNQFKIEIPNELEKGIYLLKLKNGETEKVFKLLIAK